MRDYIIGLATGIIACLFFAVTPYNYGYKDGQIDAMTGKIKYKIVNSTTWQEIKK